MFRIAGLVAILLALSAASAAADPGRILEPVIYTGATIIDGTGAKPRKGYSIVVLNRDIHIVAPDARARRIAGVTARVVDMTGTYALPGLIDSHQHLATVPDRSIAEAFLRRFVYSGVTALRDMAGDTRHLADLSRGARFEEFASPDIYYVALMAGPEFFDDPRTIDSARGETPGQVPWMQAITDQTDLKIAVAEAKGTGATAIKIYADLSQPLVAKITEEAHRQNMKVWAHAAVFPARPREVVDAGADAVSHACMLAYQAFAQMPPAYHHRPGVEDAMFAGGVKPELASLYADMKARGTVLDATLYVYDVMWKIPNPQPPPYCTQALAAKLTRQAHDSGVEISVGTDADSDWDAPYPSLFDEMQLLVDKAGFTPMQAIRAATLIGARAAGQEKQMGTLEGGKLANIVFLSKNPLADIANMKSVVLTVKRGKEYARADYKPITKDEAGE